MSDEQLNRRAARQLAERKGFDPEDIRYCVTCGRTVVYHRDIFRTDTRTDSVFCTCERYGPPMVPLESE